MKKEIPKKFFFFFEIKKKKILKKKLLVKIMSYQEFEVLENLERIISNDHVDELTVLKSLTNLVFHVFQQISQLPALFCGMKNQNDLNTNKSIQSFQQGMETLSKQLQFVEIKDSLNLIYEKIKRIEEQQLFQKQQIDEINNKLNQSQQIIVDQVTHHIQELHTSLAEIHLIKACEEGKLLNVQWLVEKEKIDINKENENGLNPLHFASQNGHLSVVEYLISKGVDPNAQDNDGWTPLHYACDCGHLPVVEYLISKKADPNVPINDGWISIHQASWKGQLQIVKYFIEKINMNIDIPAKNGSLPLHFASQNGHLQVVEYLISKGADPN